MTISAVFIYIQLNWCFFYVLL